MPNNAPQASASRTAGWPARTRSAAASAHTIASSIGSSAMPSFCESVQKVSLK